MNLGHKAPLPAGYPHRVAFRLGTGLRRGPEELAKFAVEFVPHERRNFFFIDFDSPSSPKSDPFHRDTFLTVDRFRPYGSSHVPAQLCARTGHG